MEFIDTHTHLDGEEFLSDIDEVIARAKSAGAIRLLVPGINVASLTTMPKLCQRYPGFIYQMAGLHPEDVAADWEEKLALVKGFIDECLNTPHQAHDTPSRNSLVAIGEVGLDFYWSRDFEHEQLKAFERQVEWSIETRLPLMIHCRKAQNEMVRLLRYYEKDLSGGVFHCFTGNKIEATELLQFDRFVLGVGGVSTFKKSHLAEDLAAVVPLSRIVLETDAPYMAPVPHRGERNESSFIPHIIERLALAYGVSPDDVSEVTTATANTILPVE